MEKPACDCKLFYVFFLTITKDAFLCHFSMTWIRDRQQYYVEKSVVKNYAELLDKFSLLMTVLLLIFVGGWISFV